MTYRWIHVLAATGAALVTSQAFAAGPEMVINGSFESPTHDAAGIYSGGGDNWIPSFEGPTVIIDGNITDGNRKFYGHTPYGQQYLGMDPRSQQGFVASDSQVIDGFIAGQTYLLTLAAADSDGGKAPVLQVTLNNGSSFNYVKRTFDLPVGGPYGKVIDFQKLHILFKSPVTGQITLTLSNTGDDIIGSDPGSISVDNVSIVSLSADEAAAAEAAESAHSSGFAR